MPLQSPLLLTGAPGSPYTRKMVALLRYRRVPYRLLVNTGEAPEDLPQPKVRLLPTFYLPGDDGSLEAVVDSTPLIRRFEAEIRCRPVLPRDPGLEFLDGLIEDYADEWLTKAMFHYRWAHAADAERSAAILPRWRDITDDEEAVRANGAAFAERQIGRLGVVGSNETTAPVIEASYVRFLDVFRALLESRPFVLGERPAASDFAIYGQLSQLACFDPTPRAVALERAPRVVAWCDLVDDLSGLEVAADGWIDRGSARQALGPLLEEIGRVYVPFLLANGRALRDGAELVETTIDGRPWVQRPFPYQGKCLAWLREDYESLEDDDRALVDEVLEGTGCEPLFA